MMQARRHVSESVERAWKLHIETFPERLRSVIVEYFESLDGSLSGVGAELLAGLVRDSSDVIAVHASRALARAGRALDVRTLCALLGSRRLSKWVQLQWVAFSDTETLKLKRALVGELMQAVVASKAKKA